MAERRTAEQAFQDLLDGKTAKGASTQAQQLAKLAEALRPAEPAAAPPQFKARLRSQLLAQASETPEDAFAAALDGMLLDVPTEAKVLVAVASALEPATLPTPSPAFRYQLRAKLIAEATAPATVGGRIGERLAAMNDRMRRSFRSVLASGVAAAVFAGGGAAMAASGGAMPGDALYGLKRFRESAQLATVDGVSEGNRLLKFATIRLGEIRGLTERHETDQDLYISTLDDMDAVTVEGTELLVDAFRGRLISAADLDRVSRFAQVQAQDLARLIPAIPAGARPAANDSLAALSLVRTRVSNAISGCPCPSNPLSSTPSTSGVPVDNRAPGCSCGGGADRPTSGNNDGNGTEQPEDPNNPSDPEDPEDPDDPQNPEDPDEPVIPDLPGDEENPVTDPVNDILDDLIDDDPLPLPSDLPTVGVPSGAPTLLP